MKRSDVRFPCSIVRSMSSDPLSLLLARTGVSGTVFCRAELGEPWSLRTAGSGEPGAERSAIFHVIVRGAGHVEVEPDREGVATPPRTAWRSGDVVLVPHGDPHVMCSNPELRSVPIASLDAPAGDDGLPCVSHGGDGPTTSILCGTVDFSPEAAEILRPQLPPLVHVECSTGPAAAWLDATLRMIGAEATSTLPGADAVVARLAEVLFVQILRWWIRDASQAGWLAAFADPQLSKVMGLIHDQPAAQWTAASLARRAGLSRSSLYDRFTQVVGEPPAAYLTRWRMHVARQSIRTGATLNEAATAVGYSSQAAFSRAFKRAVGESPSNWRASMTARSSG